MLANKLESAAKAVEPAYIEDVFSTYLYTGNASTQTITNGIDLAGKGGLVWTKIRSTTGSHMLFDTTRGMTYSSANAIYTNLSNQQNSLTNAIRADASGFSLGTSSSTYALNTSSATYVSWTFRKQPKFFDIVTWTGTGSAIDVAHNLGSVPGCILIKSLNDSSAQTWYAYHRGTGSNGGVPLGFEIDLSDAALNPASNPPANITATSFNTGAIYNSGAGNPTASGASYVAYLFAHNAGGFGLTGNDNVITCGSFTSNSSDVATIDLGWEPQFVLMKPTSTTGHWWMADNMRGFTVDGENYLRANSSGVEAAGTNMRLTNTGFVQNSTTGAATTYIYIAIRRGPMKVPTSGTSVFAPVTYTPTNGTPVTVTGNINPDLLVGTGKRAASGGTKIPFVDRLRGFGSSTPYLASSVTAAESTSSSAVTDMNNTNVVLGYDSVELFQWGSSGIMWQFCRAPSFFDEVCYTGTGSATTVTHNLGVAPELMIVKSRSTAGTDWPVYQSNLGGTGYLYLNTSDLASTGNTSIWNGTSPSSSAFSVGTNVRTNGSGATYVAYLFATCPGVSKVGSYIGNGTSKTIDCGFTAGARFVMIKRTDSTGDWYVWDTARGIVSGNDPHLSLNSTAAEITTDDTIDTDSTGFIVNQLSATNVNVSSATYIYLAIA